MLTETNSIIDKLSVLSLTNHMPIKIYDLIKIYTRELESLKS